VKEIKTGSGDSIIVDDDDYAYLSELKWHTIKGKNTRYARCSSSPHKRKAMHRMILKPSNGLFVDHANGNGLDNRRCNLRECTRSENAKNRIRGFGTSTYLGVNWHMSSKNYRKKNGEVTIHKSSGWRAAININGKQVHLGLFKKEEDAARAYNKAAKKHHREFASLNNV